MLKQPKIPSSIENYLKIIEFLDYEDLRACINADTVWEDGQTKRNPVSYELFATHEHLDLVKENVFTFSGRLMDEGSLTVTAKKTEDIWRSRLPELFPGHEFVVINDSELRQISFCRKRTGITADPDGIITCLSHQDNYIRWNALLSASLYPHPRLVPYLIQCLDDDDMANTLNAIISLGSSRDESVAEILLRHFLVFETGPGNKLLINDFFAFDLFRTLIKLGPRGYDPVLEVLQNYHRLEYETLNSVCELMGKTGRPEALDILVEIYFGEPELSDAALNGLLSSENQVLPKIIPLLSSGDVGLRKRAMWFIAHSFHKEMRAHLLNGLKDPHSSVREAAVFGLGRFYHRTRKDLLLQATCDRAVNVRVRAVEALGNLSDTALLPTFYSLCKDKSPKVRLEAMRAIAALDSRQGLKLLSDLYDQSTTPERLRLIKSLYAYTGKLPRLKPIITKALSDRDRRIIRETNDLIELLQ